MPYLLNAFYLCLLAVVSPWLIHQSLRCGKYRDGWREKLWGMAPVRDAGRPRAWFHAVSVGEVNALAPLLDEFSKRRPDWECVISTTTQTGFAQAKRAYPDRVVFYCPLDFSWAVRAAMARIKPNLLVLMELELWPNLIRAAKDSGASVAIVNGRLSDGSFRGYRRFRSLLASTVARVDVVAAQTRQYAERFQFLGAEPVRVVGSLKFDGAQTDRDNPGTTRLRDMAGMQARDVVMLAGSTQAPEESLALETFLQLRDDHPELRLVIVPRHPERFEEVAGMLDRAQVAWRRRSQLPTALRAPEQEPRVLLVDAMGELAMWWGAATIAYVGGSMGDRQGQNMIEPAAYGAAVSFGPKTANFRDVVSSLLQAGAAEVVRDQDELIAFARRCLKDPSHAARLGAAARRLATEGQGAAARTMDLLDELSGTLPVRRRRAA
ncbi:MAG: 3-deoxy-D-manno-octulosonic acid transferase [Planctomycetales bacterium]